MSSYYYVCFHCHTHLNLHLNLNCITTNRYCPFLCKVFDATNVSQSQQYPYTLLKVTITNEECSIVCLKNVFQYICVIHLQTNIMK